MEKARLTQSSNATQWRVVAVITALMYSQNIFTFPPSLRSKYYFYVSIVLWNAATTSDGDAGKKDALDAES